jgi:pimeloyl-ACP methyl ester carboxylesterase
MSQQVGKRIGADFEAVAKDRTRIRGSRYDGAGNGPRLVLVHSLAMDLRFWDRLIGRLPGNCSIIAYDCRGHGASVKPAGAYTIATFGDDLAAVLDHAGWPSAAAAGASVGGCATLAFTTRHRARVDGLGLTDTTDWYGEDAPAASEKRAEKAEQEGIASQVPFGDTVVHRGFPGSRLSDKASLRRRVGLYRRRPTASPTGVTRQNCGRQTYRRKRRRKLPARKSRGHERLQYRARSLEHHL